VAKVIALIAALKAAIAVVILHKLREVILVRCLVSSENGIALPGFQHRVCK
jgi:hypothetical protein